MSKRGTKATMIAIVGIAAVGSIATIAAPFVYQNFFVEPAAEAPALSADDSMLDARAEAGETLDPAELSGEWTIAEGSSAGYRVDEVLNGSPVTVTGRTEQVEGTLVVDGLTLESARFSVDVASIATDNGSRDGYFRDQAMNVSAHPTASFELSGPVTLETAPAVGEVIEQTLSGELTLAGVTQQVEFDAQLRSDGESAEIAGQIPITFADFGVEAPSLGFVSVEPTGFVEFELVASRG